MLPGLGSKLGHFLRTITHVNGFMRINVFNAQDLEMSTHWFTVAADVGEGQPIMLPFTGVNGERLVWHKSDRVYFGNSLLWRRAKNKQLAVCWEDGDVEYVREIAEWYKHRSSAPVKRYVLTYYYEPLPALTTKGQPFRYPEVQTVCTQMLDPSLNLVKE
jgi:hypothetical protein